MEPTKRYVAIGPSLAGCHEIPAEVAAGFLARGGEDIQVWDTDYIIDVSNSAALDYVVNSLSLTSVSESLEG